MERADELKRMARDMGVRADQLDVMLKTLGVGIRNIKHDQALLTRINEFMVDLKHEMEPFSKPEAAKGLS